MEQAVDVREHRACDRLTAADRIEDLDDLGKIGQRTGQQVDLVDCLLAAGRDVELAAERQPLAQFELDEGSLAAELWRYLSFASMATSGVGFLAAVLWLIGRVDARSL